MSENTNIDNTTTGTEDTGNDTTQQQGEQKTFTQEQVNAIVGERLQKERQKNETDIAVREQNLQQREFMLTAKATLSDKGYPVELLDVLKCNDNDSLNNALDTLEKHIDTIYRNHAKKITGRVPATVVASVTGNTSMGVVTDATREAMGLPTK